MLHIWCTVYNLEILIEQGVARDHLIYNQYMLCPIICENDLISFKFSLVYLSYSRLNYVILVYLNENFHFYLLIIHSTLGINCICFIKK